MANEFIIRKGLIALEDSQITGSLSVTNSVTASFFTGSYRGDGSQLTGIEGFPFTGSAGITGSLTVVGPVNATTFTGDGSQLTGIEGFPFTGSAKITGSLEVTGSVTATSFTGSLQGTATSASYVQLANIDGFTAYSASVNTAIDSVLDATTPLTATVNTTNSPFTITSQSIVIIDSTNGDVTVNLPDLNTINGTPDQKPILLYKNDYSQNVIYVEPSGSQLVNGTTQDIIVSIQIAIAYNPTSAGWVTEGTSYQSLAELELFFVPRTETGSFATTGSNHFSGSQTITGSLTVTGNITGNITGSASTASYVEYTDVANKPALVSGSAQISFNGITDKPTLVSGSSQITYSGLTGIPSGIVSGSAQIADFGIFATTGSNQFNGNQSITGSLTVSGQVVAQTLNVQQVTSSIVYSSGSNIFGNDLSNTQQFTGSLQVSGSSHNILGNVGIGPTGTPVSELQVGKSSDVTIAMSNSSSVTSGYRGSLAWYNSSNSTVANIRAGAVTDNVGTQLEFYTRPAAGSLTQRLTLDSSGNLGLGVTPSAWYTGYTALQVGESAALFSNRTSADTRVTQLANNAFLNSNASNWIYIQTDEATRYSQVSGEHQWYNAPSGTAGNAITFTQAMTLDASGRLGIGTTSPSSILEVRGSTASPQFRISRSEQTNQGLTVQAGGGVTVFDSYDGTDTVFGSYTFNSTKGSTTVERMRITSGGYLKASNDGTYYGSTGSYHEMRSSIADWTNIVSNSNASPYGIFIQYTSASPNNTQNDFLYCRDSNSTIRATIRSNGGLANYQGNDVNLSDERVKKDIEPLESYWDKFKALEIVKFKYKDQTHDDFNIGVIAQQVEQVAPEFVDVDGWNTRPKLDEGGNEIVSTEEPLKSIYTADLYHATIKVLQEAMVKIEEQQAQIEILKAEIQTLKQ